METINQDHHISYHNIAKELIIPHQTVLNDLMKAGYKTKLHVWVLNDLPVKNLVDRINIRDSLLKQNEIKPFLNQIGTGD